MSVWTVIIRRCNRHLCPFRDKNLTAGSDATAVVEPDETGEAEEPISDDSDFSHVEMIDRGHFAGLYLSDGNLYYNEGRGYSLDERKYHCLETGSLSRYGISQEEYQEVSAAFDQASEFNLPEDNRHAVVVNDKAYFFLFLPEEEDISDDPKSHYALFSCERWREWAYTGITWDYRLAEESMISAYGDYLFYARPCFIHG